MQASQSSQTKPSLPNPPNQVSQVRTTLHGMLHPTIMYKNLFNLYSVKMSFVLFGTVSQCCDATFILDDIIPVERQ